MDCGIMEIDVLSLQWNRLFRSGNPVLTNHRPTLGLTISWLRGTTVTRPTLRAFHRTPLSVNWEEILDV